MLHRPIGIGVQGLADTFFLMDIAYQSNEAIVLNKQIFETIYHAALEASCEISRDRSDLMYTLMEGSGTETCWSEKYKKNPNGSVNDIAGITNKKGNVLGLMPHPERACDPHLGGLDGRFILQALLS